MSSRLYLTALAILAGCGINRSSTDRALERMSEQPRYDLYESSRFFRNGMTMQAPPAGTVARGAALDPVLATGRTPSGGYASEVPLTITPATIALGRSRFRIYCAVCHGVNGDGQSVVASNMTERHPPSLRSPAIKALPPGFLYQVIQNGFGRMPSYASELPVDQRWAVVAYIRDSLQ